MTARASYRGHAPSPDTTPPDTTEPLMRRTARALSIVAVLMLGTACGPGAVSPAPAPVPVTTTAVDPVTWADDVCKDLQPFLDAASLQPQIDPADPAASIKSLSSYLGTAVSTLDSVIDDLSAVGPAPVPSGDAAVEELIEALEEYRSIFAGVRRDVDAVDPTSPEDIVTSLPAAVAPLEKLQDLGNPLADLQIDPELDRAIATAPSCQELNSAG
jgi:hypothetical protein